MGLRPQTEEERRAEHRALSQSRLRQAERRAEQERKSLADLAVPHKRTTPGLPKRKDDRRPTS